MPPRQHSASASLPGYRYEDAARRQSFNGLTSRPTLPVGAGRASIPGMAYNEFGASRHSVATFAPIPQPAPRRRKSRFGLSVLLGRKEKNANNIVIQAPLEVMSEKGRSRQYSYESPGRPDITPRSFSQPGLSAITRHPLQDLIQQEPDFVAYRYPSKDEHLDLSPD